MSGGVGHSSSAAGRTEATPLAREGDEPVVAAGVAMNAQESVGEHAALEISADLALDEARDGRTRRPLALEERLELLAHDAVEERLLGLVTFVTNRGGFAGTGLESKRRAIGGCLGFRDRRKSCGRRS
jgi:hypothetical protein